MIAGSPFFVIRGNRDEVEARIRKEMTEIHVNLTEEGIVIKADTIGALEALCKAGIVRRVDLGHAHTHYALASRGRHAHQFVCASCGLAKSA